VVFPPDRIPELLAAAEAAGKPVKKALGVSTPEFISEVWPAVLVLRKKGFTITQIAEFMVDHGAAVATATLLNAIKKEARLRGKPLGRGRSRAAQKRSSSAAKKTTGVVRPPFPPPKGPEVTVTAPGSAVAPSPVRPAPAQPGPVTPRPAQPGLVTPALQRGGKSPAFNDDV
jgi:hypothetical protein